MSKFGMPSYQFWTEQANRYAACVDFASPISAWTQEMHEADRDADGDSKKASELLRQRRADEQRGS